MAGSNTSIDAEKIRRDFPVVTSSINGKPMVYLDSANTSQKPVAVIDAMTAFMREGYAPINRSAYSLAAEATEKYEGARTKVAKFINAKSSREIVFTKNATEALNLIAYSWGRTNLKYNFQARDLRSRAKAARHPKRTQCHPTYICV
ncbi:MAG: aminotransferase class V-fold PLP-dependent enzyme [Actinomycetota bacterium]